MALLEILVKLAGNTKMGFAHITYASQTYYFCLSEDPRTQATLALHRHIICFWNRDDPRIANPSFNVWAKGQISSIGTVQKGHSPVSRQGGTTNSVHERIRKIGRIGSVMVPCCWQHPKTALYTSHWYIHTLSAVTIDSTRSRRVRTA